MVWSPTYVFADLHKRAAEEKAKAKAKPDYSDLWRPIDWARDKAVVQWLTGQPHEKDIKHPLRPRWLPQSVAEASEARMGIGKLEGYVVWQQDGQIVARRYARSVSGPKWWQQNEGAFIFGAEWCKKFSPPICVITEGIFDCLRLPIGTGLALLGTTLSNKILQQIVLHTQPSQKILLALDRDAPKKTVQEFYLRLSEFGYAVAVLDWQKCPVAGAKDLDEIYVMGGDLQKFLEI